MRAAFAAGLSLILAACATTSRELSPPPKAVVPELISPQAPATIDARILMVDAATAMLGQPYRYGGAGPGGFDCSGLVVYSAAGAGLRLPRTAAEQLGFGVPIARAELQAGDLIFMHLARKELHVAIALDNQRFIHAPSAGRFVRIDSLGEPAYAKGYIGARRVIPPLAGAVSLNAQQ
jgi:cell wall-associated NlpC family hydrolase